MSIPQRIVDELMARCRRRCCICRRFDPLHLQVHHIVERSDGGTDDPDNLIVVCITCHSDVHSDTKLTRRFTPEELKQHRDALFDVVAQGQLSPEARGETDISRLIDTVVSGVLPQSSPSLEPRDMLSPDAMEQLLKAVKSDGTIFDLSEVFGSGMTVEDVRERSRWKAALDELEQHELAAWVSGKLYRVTHTGFLLADEILAAGSERDQQST